MKRILGSFLVSSMLLAACKDGQVKNRVVMNDSEEGRELKRRKNLELYQRERERYPSSTYDLLPISGDTLIAATKFNGIIRTTDAGKTWSDGVNPGLVIKLLIDNQGNIWGLYSWTGIHEADRSIIYLSKDLGDTWKNYEFDTEKLFPADFYSKAKEELRIIDHKHKIYKVTNTSKLDWILVDSAKKDVNLNIRRRKDFVKDTKNRKWLFNSDGIHLIESDTVTVY